MTANTDQKLLPFTVDDVTYYIPLWKTLPRWLPVDCKGERYYLPLQQADADIGAPPVAIMAPALVIDGSDCIERDPMLLPVLCDGAMCVITAELGERHG